MTGPLAGITVLDFTWALAGPYGVMILADLGADVWKIETTSQTERRRSKGPYVHGVSTYFFSLNRGKKSIMLDLKAPEATEIVHRLVKRADVLAENFSPGTMDRLGFGYEQMREVNPALVYASTSGFGQTGPYRERGAVDIIVQGMGALMSTTGHESDPLPSRAGYSIGDMAGGMYTTIGVLSALVERAQSGEGQHVDVAMLDCQVALMENPVIRYFATGEVQPRAGLRHPLSTPHQAFPGSDAWFVLAGVRDRNWQLFCGMIGADELAVDERFSDNALRTKNYEQLQPIMFEATPQAPARALARGAEGRVPRWPAEHDRRHRSRPAGPASRHAARAADVDGREADRLEHPGEALAHPGRRRARRLEARSAQPRDPRKRRLPRGGAGRPRRAGCARRWTGRGSAVSRRPARRRNRPSAPAWGAR